MDDMSQADPTKLFVGNLPYSATEDQIREVFAQFGELVEVKLIIDKMSGRPKGIAFVKFSNAGDAAKAVEAGKTLSMDGRNLIVNVARPFVPRERGFGGGSSGFGGGRSDRGGFGGGSGFGGGNRGGYNRGPRN
jgi:RNA recognition motif-containing protein